MTPEFVSTPRALDELCERLGSASFLALDTEFVRVRTYFPVLCLIQINDGDNISCIDTIALDDLTPLMTLIGELSSALTIHAGRQDFEALYQRSGQLPAAVWDTQIAAAMLDLGDQVSYAQLVKLLAGIELDKSHTRTNWARRPLSDGQLHYAAEDVLYLPAIREQLHERLSALGRLEWLLEECAALLDVDYYKPSFEQAWRRCKLRRPLPPVQRGAWKLLCELREKKAAEFDRPRRWVLEDNALEELATLDASDDAAIVRILRSGRVRRELGLAEVRTALSDPPPAHDAGGARPDPQQISLVDACLADVRSTAQDLGLSTSLLATRREVMRLVHGERDLSILRGWREHVIGEELLKRVSAAN